MSPDRGLLVQGAPVVKKSVEPLTADLTPSSIAAGRYAAAPTGTEAVLAEVLAGVMHAESVPLDSNFFEDLGADSMVMAQFCARVRKRPELPPVSMKDLYQHPTIAALATALSPPPSSGSAVAAAGPVEGLLAGVLADIMHTQVPV